jgi:hypothetical protein
MRILVAYIVVVLSASMSASIGSPCSQDIDHVQAKIDAMLEAQAVAGGLRPREHGSHHASSTDTALDCRRRGPAWDISQEQLTAVEGLMTDARAAV